MRPSPEQVREALAVVKEVFGRCPVGQVVTTREPHDYNAIAITLESALAPPPVEDAAVEEALDADAFDNHLRHLALRDNIDSIQQSYEDQTGCIQEEAVGHLRKVHATLRAALAAAENRGFRAAVEWFDEEAYVKKECIAIARAEADRREGE